MKRLLLGAGGAVIALIALCEWLGATAPTPTPEQVRATCASAPDPNRCFADAMAKVMAPKVEAIEAQQRSVEARAAAGD